MAAAQSVLDNLSSSSDPAVRTGQWEHHPLPKDVARSGGLFFSASFHQKEKKKLKQKPRLWCPIYELQVISTSVAVTGLLFCFRTSQRVDALLVLRARQRQQGNKPE